MNSKISKKPLLILDTNILIYLFDKLKIVKIFEILKQLYPDHELSISTYTHYEIIGWGSKNILELVKTLNLFRNIHVDMEVLIFAGLMKCLGIRKNGDSIIASTSFLNNALILTANHRDFPEPYFKEIKFWPVDYRTDKNRTNIQTIHLLKPNLKSLIVGMNKIEWVKIARERSKEKEKTT